mmetsp:Transcript_37660/g.117354  ORF Transcript_37660/g.117354 Transcript_37660/m.117354 type:complete len:217 (+) Transcript_37660:1591-2241(+)
MRTVWTSSSGASSAAEAAFPTSSGKTCAISAVGADGAATRVEAGIEAGAPKKPAALIARTSTSYSLPGARPVNVCKQPFLGVTCTLTLTARQLRETLVLVLPTATGACCGMSLTWYSLTGEPPSSLGGDQLTQSSCSVGSLPTLMPSTAAGGSGGVQKASVLHAGTNRGEPPAWPRRSTDTSILYGPLARSSVPMGSSKAQSRSSTSKEATRVGSH